MSEYYSGYDENDELSGSSNYSEQKEDSEYNEYSEYIEYNRIMENPDYALDSKTETKKQKHIIIIFAVLLVGVILAIFIFNLWLFN